VPRYRKRRCLAPRQSPIDKAQKQERGDLRILEPGTDVVGLSFGLFEGPPTFQEQALGAEAVLPAKLGFFGFAIVLGAIPLWLGFRRWQGAGSGEELPQPSS
jgi:hypothetical protein